MTPVSSFRSATWIFVPMGRSSAFGVCETVPTMIDAMLSPGSAKQRASEPTNRLCASTRFLSADGLAEKEYGVGFQSRPFFRPLSAAVGANRVAVELSGVWAGAENGSVGRGLTGPVRSAMLPSFRSFSKAPCFKFRSVKRLKVIPGHRRSLLFRETGARAVRV
jgi:hypothetical protein